MRVSDRTSIGMMPAEKHNYKVVQIALREMLGQFEATPEHFTIRETPEHWWVLYKKPDDNLLTCVTVYNKAHNRVSFYLGVETDINDNMLKFKHQVKGPSVASKWRKRLYKNYRMFNKLWYAVQHRLTIERNAEMLKQLHESFSDSTDRHLLGGR